MNSVETLEERSLLAATLTGTLDASNNLVIADTAGVTNNLTVLTTATNIVVTDAVEQFAPSSISGAVLSNGDRTLTVPLASISGAQFIINAGAGSDVVDLTAFDAGFNLSVIVNGDADADVINANASLALTGSSDISLTAESLNVAAVTLSTVNGNQTYNGSLTLSGSTLSTSGAGVITLGGDVGVSGTAVSQIAGQLNLNSATRTFSVADIVSGDDLIVSASMSGGGLVKSGAGDMQLSGSNTYAGATGLSDGVLALSNNNALGATTGVVATATATGGIGIRGSRVELRNVTIAGVPLTLNSTSSGDLRSGLITTTVGTNTWTGAVTVQGNGTTYFAAGDSAGENLIVSGNVTGVGFTGTHKVRAMTSNGLGSGTLSNTVNLGASGILFKDDDNNWTFSGSGSSWEMTQIARGTLTLGQTDALATNARLQLGDATAFDARLILNGFNQRLGSVVKVGASTGTVRIVNGSATPVTLTIDTASTATYSGFVGGTGSNDNNLSLIKQGSGTQTLTGTNSYTGTTTITAGTLGTGSSSANLGSGTATNTLIFNGGTLLMGGFTSPSARSVQFLADATIRDSGANNIISGVISGPYNLIKADSGVLNLGNSANSFGGAGKSIIVQGGTIAVGSDEALGDLANGLIFQSGTPIFRATASFTTNRSLLLNTSGRVGVSSSTALIMNGLVSGAGQLSLGITGTNMQIVLSNGANSYTGDTFVEFGTLQVTASGALGGTAGGTSVSTGAVLDLLNVNYVPTEALTLNNATLRVSSGTSSWSGSVSLNSGTPTIDVAGTQLTVSGVVSGAANVTKSGNGTLILSGSNSHSGTVNVMNGTLLVHGSLANGSATTDVTLQSATTLGGTGIIHGAVSSLANSTIDPGPVTGTLGIGGLTLSSTSTYRVDLQGSSPGSGYDQLAVTGSVSLSSATLSLNVGFTPANNFVFTLIDNDGVDAVSGTFNGLPEGSIIVIGSVGFELSYVGGTGNDVVLRADTLAPEFTSLVRRVPATSPTNADSLTFRATFNEKVLNVSHTDFVVTGSTASVQSVTPISDTVFDLVVSGGDLAGFSGTVGINLAPTQNITDLVLQALPNLEPSTDETYVLDNTAPRVAAFTRSSPASPTNADSIVFLAEFDEDVGNVDMNDFAVNGTTTASVTSVSSVTGRLYLVTVSGGDLAVFNGTVGLDVAPAQDIVDTVGNLLLTTEPTTDEVFVIDNEPPTVDISDVTPDPRFAAVSSIQIVFNQAVTGFDLSDLSLRFNAGANLLTGAETLTSADAVTWTLGGLAGLTATDGDYQLSLIAGGSGISDVAGNALVTGATDDWTKLPAIFDFGDAPDTYGTTLAALGPYHIATGLRLGASRDTENDPVAPLDGSGDDASNTGAADDEDGASVLASLVRFGTSAVRVEASAPGFLDAWLDIDVNGVFDDPAERFGATGFGTSGSIAVAAGLTTLVFDVPATLTTSPTTTYARFRLSTVGGLSATNSFAVDGEVEDHLALIVAPPLHVLVDDDYTGATPGDVLDGGVFGVDRFDTLTQAVRVVADAGTVEVKPGTYPELVLIDKNLTLTGTTGIAADVVINPPGNATPGIQIDSLPINIELSHLTVTGAADGIQATTSGQLLVTNVSANGNADNGIDFNQATGTLFVTSSRANGNGSDGLRVDASDAVQVGDSTFDGLLVRSTNSFETAIGPVISTRAIDVETLADISISAVGDIDAGSHSIRLAANADGAGSGAFFMANGAVIATTRDDDQAIVITVNAMLGGTGNATLGEIRAGQTAGTSGGRISIDAGNGKILDGNGPDRNLDAGNAVLIALAGVGELGAELETNVAQLEGVGGTGDFRISNSRALAIGGLSAVIGVTAAGGEVSIVTQNSLVADESIAGGGDVVLHVADSANAGDDLTISGGVSISSSSGDVELAAGDDITLAVNSLVAALVGSVLIQGDWSNADVSGSNIELHGLISSATGATATGESDGDRLLVTSMGSGGLRLDGRNGNDDYIVTYPNLPVTFGSTIVIEDSGTGSDAVTINGTDAADEIFLTTQDPPTTGTRDEVSRGSIGTEVIQLSDGVERVSVLLHDGIDVMHAQPSRLFPVFLDGGDPCFGEAGVPPGDELQFDPIGHAFGMNGNVIQTLGGTPTAFQPVEFINFESLPLTPLGAPSGGALPFDFNHSNTAGTVSLSPTQAGFIGVSPKTLYSGGLGYGWRDEIRSFERDDGFYANSYADLIRDGHSSSSPATFTVDVPNGWYLVSALLGSPYADISGVSIDDADSSIRLVANISTLAGESKNVSAALFVSDGTLDVRFLPSGEPRSFFAVNGLSIRPAELLSMGLDCPAASLEADGVTIDSFTLLEAPPNALITVTTSRGQLRNADADDELQGLQVRANALGQATLLLQRPTGAGTAVISFEEVTGAARGLATVSYVLPTARRFDLNHLNRSSAVGQSPTQTPIATNGFPSGFLGVLPTRSYHESVSFGWLTTPRSFDLGTTTNSQGEVVVDPNPLAALRRDGAFDNAERAFRVDLPNGTYLYRATIGYDRDVDGMRIEANGSFITDIAVRANQRTQVTGSLAVTNGTAIFRFSNLGGTAPNWVLNGLEIRPETVVQSIAFAPNIGSTPADGTTITPVTATTTLDDGEQVTVATTLGTIITADVNASLAGVQVVVSAGRIEFELLAPLTPGVPTLNAVSLDGSHQGSVSLPTYLNFAAATGRRFDFNHVRRASSNSASPTAAGFVGVLRTDTDRSGHGVGWDVAPNSYDVGVPGPFDQGGSNTYSKLTTSLYRDYHSGHVALGSRTFSVLADGPATYDVRVYLGSQDRDTSTQVSVEGIAVPQSRNLKAKHFDFVTFASAFDADHDGFIEITFSSTNAWSPLWSATGLDVVLTGAGLPLAAPLTATDLGTGYGRDTLTQEELLPLVTLAIDAWTRRGLSTEEAAVLGNASIVIRDLGESAALGIVDGNGRIVLDDDGAGWGWSLQPDLPAGDRYDLLTVIAHEFGHLLGMEDRDPVEAVDDVMSAFLAKGQRHNELNGIDDFFSGVWLD